MLALSTEYLHRLPSEVDCSNREWLELMAFDRIKRDWLEKASKQNGD